jgi:hypothetical protein
VIPAVLFVSVAGVLAAAVVLAMLGISHVYYLSTARAIPDDGMTRGAAAPAWVLADSAGSEFRSPPRHKLFQLIVFADHSLKSFPSSGQALRELLREPELEIVLLTRQQSELAEPVLGMLGLGEIPVLTGSPALYGLYNVRVMPFAIIVDSAGRVRASGLASLARQLSRLWWLAAEAPAAAPDAAAAIPAARGAGSHPAGSVR